MLLTDYLKKTPPCLLASNKIERGDAFLSYQLFANVLIMYMRKLCRKRPNRHFPQIVSIESFSNTMS